jgi:hypothetical protein
MYKLTHIDVQVKSHGSSTTFRTRWARVRHLGRHDAAYNNDFRDFTRSPLIRARAPRRRAGRSVHGGQLRPIAHRLPGCGCASRGCAEPSAIDSSATVWAWTGIAPQSAEVSRTTLHPRARARVAGWTASGSVHPNGARRGPRSSLARLPRSATSCVSPPSTWRPCARSRRSQACSIRVRAGRSGGACRGRLPDPRHVRLLRAVQVRT